MKAAITKLGVRAIVFCAFFASSAPIMAAELQKLAWEPGAEGEALSLHFDFRPVYEVMRSDDGLRHDVILRNTRLSPQIKRVRGRAGVQNVGFASDPKTGSVVLVVMLDKPGDLQFRPSQFGYQITNSARPVLASLQAFKAKIAPDASQPVQTGAQNGLTAAAAQPSKPAPQPASEPQFVAVANNKPAGALVNQAANEAVNEAAMFKPAQQTLAAAATPTSNRVSTTLAPVSAQSQTQSSVEPLVVAQAKQPTVKQPPTPAKPAMAEEEMQAESEQPAETMMMAANEKAAINEVKYSVLPGGKVQIDIESSQPLEEPKTFSTSQPARMVMDFFGASNVSGSRSIPVNVGALETISLIETSERVRVVLNLLKIVPIKTRQRENGLTMVVAGPSEGTGIPQPKTSQFDRKGQGAEFAIKRVDFRRTRDGGGKIEIEMSQPGVTVDVKQQGGELVADFLKTSVDQSLEKRLNVVDFATPVNTIDTFASGSNTRLIINANGDYRHLAFQTGTSFTLQVLPPAPEEEVVETDEFGYTGEKLSLNFQKIGVREALGVLSDFTGVNFVTSDSVAGDLTLRLQDVPWDQALDVILQAKGLAKRERGNVIWVAPQEEIQEQERLTLEASKQVAELEPLVSELIQINYAKAKDISELLKSIKSVDTGVQQSLFGSVSVAEVQTDSNSLLSSRGQVTVDERTNTLLVQDTPGKLLEIRKLIAKLDRPVRQVMIETRIVEANDDFSRTLGARLGFTRQTEEAQFPGVAGSNIGDVFTSGSIEENESVRDDQTTTVSDGSEPSRIAVNLPAIGIDGDSASSLAFTISKAGSGFLHLIDLELSALEAEGEGKIIANPRLVTADQKEAHIEQGQERIFTTTVLGVGSVVTKKAVLGLTVTPQITPDDRLVLDVFITKDSFVSADDPTINTKQVRTQVLLENGETVVIGGVYQQSQTSGITKTPILGDIPLLGNLFKKKSRSDNRTELLVFLTPKILSPALNL